MLHRKKSLNDIFFSSDDDRQTTMLQRNRRASLSVMNRIKPFFNVLKNDDLPENYYRVRQIRDSCKVFSDVFKSDRDFLSKNIENEICKSFREFRTNDPSKNGLTSPRSVDHPSILCSTIDDFINIHESIEEKRKEWFDKVRSLAEQAKEKQNSIRQTLTDHRDEYEKAVKKCETAETNLRKFQSRDRPTIQNYENRLRELEDAQTSSVQLRSSLKDVYAAETCRLASEEHSITREYFLQFLNEEKLFYEQIGNLLSQRIPNVEKRLNEDKYAPSLHCDLAEHCLKRIQRPIAYPIETCIRLLEYSIKDEGLFRIGPSQAKQKKLIAQLDLQAIDSKMQLKDLEIDSNVVAGALKQYLRDLPECLLTDALFTQWIQVTSLSSEEERIQKISELLTKLPKVNYNNLCYLIRFLNRVSEHSSDNKMTATNLGVCIGCSLLYSKDQSTTSYMNSSSIIELMITHYKQLFPEHTQQDLQIIYKTQQDSNGNASLQRTPPNSNENLEVSQITNLVQPSPRLSTKHRAPPPPPLPRPLLIPIEPSNIGETSTEYSFPEQKSGSIRSLNSPTIEKDRRFGMKRNSLSDRLNALPRISLTKKDQDRTPTKDENNFMSLSPTLNDADLTTNSNQISTLNNDSGQTNDIQLSSNCDTFTSSPEITQF